MKKSLFILLWFIAHFANGQSRRYFNEYNNPTYVPSASIVVIVFTTTNNLSFDNTTFAPNTYWKPTVIGTPTWADGIASLGIPAGQDGWVQTDINYAINTQQFGLCLHTSNTMASNPFYNVADYMIYKHVAGNYYTGAAGSFVDSGVAAADGDKLRLRRTGNTVYAEYYRSSVWTVAYTFPTTTSAKLYPGASADNANAYEVQLLNVIGYNIQ